MTHRHRQQYGDSHKERRMGEVEVRDEGINGEGKRLDFGLVSA